MALEYPKENMMYGKGKPAATKQKKKPAPLLQPQEKVKQPELQQQPQLQQLELQHPDLQYQGIQQPEPHQPEVQHPELQYPEMQHAQQPVLSQNYQPQPGFEPMQPPLSMRGGGRPDNDREHMFPAFPHHKRDSSATSLLPVPFMRKKMGMFYTWQVFVMWMAISGTIAFVCTYGAFRKYFLSKSRSAVPGSIHKPNVHQLYPNFLNSNCSEESPCTGNGMQCVTHICVCAEGYQPRRKICVPSRKFDHRDRHTTSSADEPRVATPMYCSGNDCPTRRDGKARKRKPPNNEIL
ncbi:uncharacterized protein LOC135396198 [Ornithodoros turicata]|uniref:uncharacterized protein LOC135396198 n=1 Tax=Ornithodoros turicata TaxID=34597 RepID=UPI003138EC1A